MNHGLATLTAEKVRAGGKLIAVAKARITEAGRSRLLTIRCTYKYYRSMASNPEPTQSQLKPPHPGGLMKRIRELVNRVRLVGALMFSKEASSAISMSLMPLKYCA